MRRSLRLLIPIASLVLASCAAPSREPLNLSIAKEQAGKYAKENYPRDLARVSQKAKTWVAKRAEKGGKLAIVFDIDETTLSNLPHIQKEDYGYQPKVWDEWVATSKAPAITSVREVYQTAIAKNVAVFFITGRKQSDRIATINNLKHEGYSRYSGLIVKPNDSPHHLGAAAYKTPQRKKITDQGYTIIANVGDQQSDLDGGYSEKNFKLPNPFYRIP